MNYFLIGNAQRQLIAMQKTKLIEENAINTIIRTKKKLFEEKRM